MLGIYEYFHLFHNKNSVFDQQSFQTTIDRVIVIHAGNVQGLIEIYRLYLHQVLI